MFITLFEIPLPYGYSLPFYSFGFLMLLCFLSSYVLLAKYCEISGLRAKLAEDMITYAGVGGVLGARIFSILSNPRLLFLDPIGTILSSAGFVFYGGLIGGMLAVYILLRKQNLSYYRMTDLVAPVLALGYAVGRIGCQLSGDGDYGVTTDYFWATSYKYGVVATESLVHPTPVYESIFSVLILLFLTANKTVKHFSKQGQIFGLYLILSSCIRFNIEYLRIEDRLYMNLSQAQLISIPLFILGLVLVFYPSKSQSAFLNNYHLNDI